MRRFGIAIGAGIAAAVGAIAATVWVGVSVREDTVVAHPYEDGLRQDAERHARAALGLAVSLPGLPDAGAGPIAFELRDRAGKPVDDAQVAVELSRPDTSRGERAAPARPLGGGRWTADLAFPEPGPWDVRFDVTRGKDRVRLERRVGVRAACDLGAGPCARALEGGGEIVLDLSPRPLRTMAELTVRVQVRGPPLPGPLPRSAGERGDLPSSPMTSHAHTHSPLPQAAPGGEGSDQDRGRARPSHSPLPPAAQGGEGQGEGAGPLSVTVSFSMPRMTMGENRATLSAIGPGTYEGKAVLVRCASGRRDWIADVELGAPGGASRVARFPLTLPEGAR